MEVYFTALPISLPCPVPVLPGTRSATHDGEPIPLGERTGKCGDSAYWMIGAQVACDLHMREACDILAIDFDGLVAERDVKHHQLEARL